MDTSNPSHPKGKRAGARGKSDALRREVYLITLSAKDDAETSKLFDALADGGQVTMPLGKTFFASSFGMVTDKFGVAWMVLTGE